MAKRAVWDAALVSQQSALTWAAAQKEPKQCGFDPHTTDTPCEGYWCAELTLHAPSNQWRVLYVTNVVTLERWFNIYNIDHWIGWRQVSLAVTPEVHDLPLADGWQTHATSISWYSKDQFGQVTVYFRLKSTSETDCNEVEIAVLPEGFKPQNGVTMPGLITFANYTRVPCHVDINANGVVQLYADGSVPSDQKVIELTCAEFHYPAG